ncbi:hypothetical protein EDC01DRAFT_631718 [Geopyxis carbonaria]|nr:hypothetical protein EDC01DRAFT_631718 [Geopyxis carbonaria]
MVIDHSIGGFLRNEFETICATLQSDAIKLSLDAVIKQLLDVEARYVFRTELHNPSTSDRQSKLLYISRSNDQHYSSNQPGNFRRVQNVNQNPHPHNPRYVMGSGCDFHGSNTHTTSECGSLKRRRQEEQDAYDNRRCYHCGLFGHRQHNCPQQIVNQRNNLPNRGPAHGANTVSPVNRYGDETSQQQESPPMVQALPPNFDMAKYQLFLANLQAEHKANFVNVSPPTSTVSSSPIVPKASKPHSDKSSTSSATDVSRR